LFSFTLQDSGNAAGKAREKDEGGRTSDERKANSLNFITRPSTFRLSSVAIHSRLVRDSRDAGASEHGARLFTPVSWGASGSATIPRGEKKGETFGR
jgi:hypothetical protein